MKEFLADAHNEKAYKFLMRFYGSMKLSQKLIDKKRIFQNEELVKVKNEILNGKIYVVKYLCNPTGLKPIYENDNFAVFDKPSGVLSHPNGRNCQYSLYDEIWHLYGYDAAVAHRLDKETSGLILVSKNKKYQNLLKSAFENRAVQKTYVALVHGKITDDFIVSKAIQNSNDENFVKTKMEISDNGKEAITEFKVIEYFDDINATLLKICPKTGRQHQIRLHLFHVKHKILGEPLYGLDNNDVINI